MTGRDLDNHNPEDALWVSCPTCDALPGDGCIFDFNPDLPRPPGFDKAIHQARVSSMQYLIELEQEPI